MLKRLIKEDYKLYFDAYKDAKKNNDLLLMEKYRIELTRLADLMEEV